MKMKNILSHITAVVFLFCMMTVTACLTKDKDTDKDSDELPSESSKHHDDEHHDDEHHDDEHHDDEHHDDEHHDDEHHDDEHHDDEHHDDEHHDDVPLDDKKVKAAEEVTGKEEDEVAKLENERESWKGLDPDNDSSGIDQKIAGVDTLLQQVEDNKNSNGTAIADLKKTRKEKDKRSFYSSGKYIPFVKAPEELQEFDKQVKRYEELVKKQKKLKKQLENMKKELTGIKTKKSEGRLSKAWKFTKGLFPGK